MNPIQLITAMIQLKQQVTEMSQEDRNETFECFISGAGKRALLPSKVEIYISMAGSQQDNM